MKKTVNSFGERFNEVVQQVERFAFLVRGRKFHASSINALAELLRDCKTSKDRAIAEQLEDDANAYLSFEYMAKALVEEFRFYLALKDDDPDAAWDHLINAQSAAASAMKSHSIASHLTGYIQKLDGLERLLFPKPIFFSCTLIVMESKCSICGEDYEECDHVIGIPYMGRLCARIITKYDIPEVSPVSDPANKHARVLSLPDEQGIERSFFTHEAIEQEVAQQANEKKPESR